MDDEKRYERGIENERQNMRKMSGNTKDESQNIRGRERKEKAQQNPMREA